MKIAVIGDGAWALSMARLLYENGHEVALWSFLPETCDLLRQRRGNEKLLPGLKLPDDIEISTDFAIAQDCRMWVVATPSFGVAGAAKGLLPYIGDETVCVLLSKGFDKDNGHCLLGETLSRTWGGAVPIVALTGPSHAEEVARQVPTALVAASENPKAAALVQSIFMNEFLRVYTSSDIVGAQLGAAMKNIMALAVGVSDGAGYGDNTKAMLMTRGIAEMSRLGALLGGRPETFAGLSGVGDLIVTCISEHSRNRRAGLLIGGGASPRQAIEQVGAVVEGFFATKAIHELTQSLHVELPICTAMHKLLFECVPLGDVVSAILSRGGRPESDQDLVSKG